MSDLNAFRAETRAFIDEQGPKSLQGRMNDPDAQIWGGKKEQRTIDQQRWLDACVERGLTAPTWPKEYGGGGLSASEAKIFSEELRRARMPAPLTGFGLSMIGPTLLEFGTPDQKQEHLPRITHGEIRWCQGYSEPNAGSDLASLSCDAKDAGDHFIVNGQKTWTSYGERSDWMFLLVRTDKTVKKQAGITFILVDLETPGITIKPILLISGASPFCETFLEDVRIPKKNVVSEINAGWTVAKALLGHERSMIASAFGTGQRSKQGDQVALVARQYLGNDEGRLDDPIIRDRVVQLMMDQECFVQTVQRAQDGARAGHRPGPESSLFKVYGTELNQRREELLCSIRGPQSVGWQEPGFSEDELTQTRQWLRSRGNTIEGGTSEIQLNIIAKAVLGLPE